MPERKTTNIDLRKRESGQGDKYTMALGRSSRGGLTWSDCDADSLLAAVHAATEDGAAILLGKTQDGGALTIQVWNAAGRHKLYPASMAELSEALQVIEETAKA